MYLQAIKCIWLMVFVCNRLTCFAFSEASLPSRSRSSLLSRPRVPRVLCRSAHSWNERLCLLLFIWKMKSTAMIHSHGIFTFVLERPCEVSRTEQQILPSMIHSHGVSMYLQAIKCIWLMVFVCNRLTCFAFSEASLPSRSRSSLLSRPRVPGGLCRLAYGWNERLYLLCVIWNYESSIQ